MVKGYTFLPALKDVKLLTSAPPPEQTPAKTKDTGSSRTEPRGGKRRLCSPSSDPEKRTLSTVQKKHQKSDFFLDSRERKFGRREPKVSVLKQEYSLESIGNVHNICQDVRLSSAVSDRRHSGPRVWKVYRGWNAKFVRQYPPRGLGYPE